MRFSIKAKLAAASGLVLLLLGTSACLGIMKLGALNERLAAVVDDSVQQLDLARDMRTSSVQVDRFANLLIAAGDDAAALAADKDIQKHLVAFSTAAGAYRKAASEEQQQRLDAVLAAWKAYTKLLDQVRKLGLASSYTAGVGMALGSAKQDYEAVLAALDAIETRVPNDDAGKAVRADMLALRNQLQELRFTATVSIIDTDDAHLAELDRKAERQREETGAAIAALSSRLGQAFPDELQRLHAAWDAYLDTHRSFLRATSTNSYAHAFAIASGPGKEALQQAMAMLDELVERSREEMERSRAAAQSEYDSARRSLVITAVAGLIASVVTMAWIGLGISRGLGRVVRAAEAVAVGDLSHRVRLESRDEIGALGQA
ncbi:MCP four helix bundle domain-containing protein, partial [Benzoatithermus flavus]